MTTATTFGAWVRQRRRALDLTQAELAGTIGYSTITVRRVESGERRPSRELIDSLAAGLRVPGDQLDAFRDLGRRLVGSAPPPTAGSRTTAAGRLQPPPPPAYAITRPRLTDRLDQAWAVPLTVVTAATGFGKSVAAAAWAEQHGAAWLTLGGTDSPVESLAGALVDAVRLTVPSLDPGCLGRTPCSSGRTGTRSSGPRRPPPGCWTASPGPPRARSPWCSTGWSPWSRARPACC